MFNARSETLAESPVFRRLLPTQRCVFIVNGFYEWHQETESRKQPYYVGFGEDKVMKFAGLFDYWHDASTNVKLYTCTMITTRASSRIKWLHGRMPVVLETTAREACWLDEQNTIFPENFFEPCNSSDLIWHPVTPSIGKLSFQGPECYKDVRTKGINRFFQSNIKGKATTHEAAEENDHDSVPRPDISSAPKPEDSKAFDSAGRKRKKAVLQGRLASPAKRKKSQRDIKQFFSSG